MFSRIRDTIIERLICSRKGHVKSGELGDSAVCLRCRRFLTEAAWGQAREEEFNPILAWGPHSVLVLAARAQRLRTSTPRKAVRPAVALQLSKSARRFSAKPIPSGAAATTAK